MSSKIGRSVEDYEIIDEIGKGGFATVYKARCRNTHRTVAIKKMEIKNMVEKMVKRVKEEISIHSKLDHASIVKFYTYFQDCSNVYIILECCPNGNLDQRRKKKKGGYFSEREAVEYLAQILDGMCFLHSHGIMHRDLTLQNILLDSEDRAKIADFGLATVLRSLEDKHVTMCGTPNYMSPEVAGKMPHGLETDVWNFGVLIYIMLVGKSPFPNELRKAPINTATYRQYEVPHRLSNSAKDLIQKCLKKDKLERVKLHDLVRHPFFKMSEGTSFNTYRSDSGVYTMSTNGTTSHHTKTPLSMVREDSELHSHISSAYHSQKYSTRNEILAAPNSPPVKLRSSPHERAHQHVEPYHQKRRDDRAFVNGTDPVFCGTSAQPPKSYSNRPRSFKENDIISEGRDGSSMSTRSDHCCGKVDNRFHRNEICPRETRSYEEQRKIGHKSNNAHYVCYPETNHNRVGSPDSKNTNQEHRRSISSDGRITSSENRCSQNVRSSSLDRERYENERCKDRKARTHRTDCKCLDCNKNNELVSLRGYHSNDKPACCSNDEHGSGCHSNDQHGSGCHSNDQHGNGCHSNDQHGSGCHSNDKPVSYHSTGSCSNRSNHNSETNRCTNGPEYPQRSPKSNNHYSDRVLDNESSRTPVPSEYPISVSQNKSIEKKLTSSSSSSGKLLENYCSPLTSRRLKPKKKHIKPNMYVSVLEDGEVCLEVLQMNALDKRVVEVFRISHDGMKITVYRPNARFSDQPPEILHNSSCKVFNYHDLPQMYWRKYCITGRCINFLRSVTPKVIYYSDQGKCCLMENLPDANFEVTFYSGESIKILPDSVIQTTDLNGNSTKYNEQDCQSKLSSVWLSRYKHAHEMKRYCFRVENELTKLENETGYPNFPVELNKKPTVSNFFKKRSRGKENLSPESVQSSVVYSCREVVPYEESIDKETTEREYPRFRKPLKPCQNIDFLPLKSPRNKFYIDGVGTVYEEYLPEGQKLKLAFTDGTSFETGGKGDVITYTDILHSQIQYPFEKNCIPDHLKEKLQQFFEAVSKVKSLNNNNMGDTRTRVAPIIKPDPFLFLAPRIVSRTSRMLR